MGLHPFRWAFTHLDGPPPIQMGLHPFTWASTPSRFVWLGWVGWVGLVGAADHYKRRRRRPPARRRRRSATNQSPLAAGVAQDQRRSGPVTSSHSEPPGDAYAPFAEYALEVSEGPQIQSGR